MKPHLLTAALSILLATAGASPREDPADARARDYLASTFHLDGNDFDALANGRAVARTLDVQDDREVASVGAVLLHVPASFYADELKHVTGFKSHEGVLQLGTFGTPARLSDVAALTLDREDAEHLARCRPRECDIQLSSGAMARFRRALAGNEGNVQAADEVMRGVLVDLVNQYRQSGDSALMTYTDSDHPLSTAAQFRRMIAVPPRFLDHFEALNAHMLRYPSRANDGVDDVIYWSKTKLGPSTIVTVTHLAIERVRDGSPVAFAAASRQLYGTHYFDASLGVTVLVDRGPDCILVYANRSRLDALGGFFGGIKRAIVRSRTRSAMARNLAEAREQAERRYAGTGGSRGHGGTGTRGQGESARYP